MSEYSGKLSETLKTSKQGPYLKTVSTLIVHILVLYEVEACTELNCINKKCK